MSQHTEHTHTEHTEQDVPLPLDDPQGDPEAQQGEEPTVEPGGPERVTERTERVTETEPADDEPDE